jgi:hypothetical protein
MPFLTVAEFKQILGEKLGTTMLAGVDFPLLEASASSSITDITGIDAPADALDAAPWQKRACAFLIGDDCIGHVAGISQENLLWFHRQYEKAMSELERRKSVTPTGETPSQIGPIDGLLNEW